MKCLVTFRRMKPSDAIRSYAEERVEKIARLIDRDGEAQVVLSIEKHLSRAHIELLTDGSLRMRGVHESDDMYASIDAAVERIIRQVKRYRDKIRNHREPTASAKQLARQVFQAEQEEEIVTLDMPAIVRQEKVTAYTMSVPAAVMQMDLLNADFLVFTNEDDGHLNILERLPNGELGLIEATQD